MAAARLCAVLLPLCASVAAVRGLFRGGTGDYRRQVSMELNPGANGSVGLDLLHVRAVGPGDTLHWVLGSQGPPALLLVHTDSPNSSLTVDWPRLLSRNSSGSLKVEPQSSVRYASALLFRRIWEYDDTNDTADPTHAPPSSFLPPYELDQFSWDDLNRTLNRSSLSAQLCGRPSSSSSASADTFQNGSLCLEFSAFDSWGRSSAWPRLLHSANTSQLRVLIKGVAVRSNHSRLVLELAAVVPRDQPSRVDTLHSIDDEYSPTIFQVCQWVTLSPGSSSAALGFSQWKPVGYRSEKLLTEFATPARHSAPEPRPAPARPSLARAFFGEQLGEGYQVSGLNLTFGIAGEPFYNSTQYLSWTVLVGVGSPPWDSFSVLVLSIMAVALGTPALLLLLGGVCVCVKRKGRAPPQYEPIN
ncbi:glycosylated lysosomal membrane protein [Amia ocellicauda]|uniref:glycosylated lysosomal membrane protein n=1 Tax=Amia ocellicauda TaxID=2972642 RepID=UPI0034646CA6